ncbi:MAG TPA: protease SohB, partial [Pseudomonadales bacterium]
MDHLYGYLQFLAETVTIVVAILVVLSAGAAMGFRRQQHGESGHLEVKKLNDRLLGLKDSLRQAVLPPAQFKKLHRADSKVHKQEQKQAAREAKVEKDPASHVRPRVFVLHFEGDLQASSVEQLRTEITAVLTMADASDEVVVCLESPGGAVHGYGLAASQLDRIRARGIPLIAAVDKVAASGGYLMAAVADRILAAPFAVIGSIGVLAQIPNIHRLLKKHDVDVELLTAGKYKRTLTVLGENTEEGRQKFIEELEDIHAQFQEFVGSRRPQLDMAAVATGEVWYGDRALARNLVDELCTSDEYLARACEEKDVYEVRWVEHKRPIERLMAHVEGAVVRLVDRIT